MLKPSHKKIQNTGIKKDGKSMRKNSLNEAKITYIFFIHFA